MTQRLEMEVRKWRAYSRPSGVTATTLDTSRRLLTRRSSGVKPRRAQVVPGRARKLWPVSSQRRSVRCSRCAFFQSHPFPLGPDRDHEFVALPSPGGRALHAEAVRLERTLQITRVIADPELALNQGRNAFERPALGGKARRHGTPVQEPTQTSPSPLSEAGYPSWNRACFQAVQALLGEGCGPAADTGAADPKFAGDLGLRKPPLA